MLTDFTWTNFKFLLFSQCTELQSTTVCVDNWTWNNVSSVLWEYGVKNRLRKLNSILEMMKGGISHVTHHSLYSPAGRRTVSSLLPTASCPQQPMRSHYQFHLSYSSTKLSFERITPNFLLSAIQEHSFPLFSRLNHSLLVLKCNFPASPKYARFCWLFTIF